MDRDGVILLLKAEEERPDMVGRDVMGIVKSSRYAEAYKLPELVGVIAQRGGGKPINPAGQEKDFQLFIKAL